MRLLVVHGNDKVETMRGQCAQDQFEIAKRVRTRADTGAYGPGGIVASDTRSGAIGGSGAGAECGLRTGGELREKLTADLLKPLVVYYTTGGQDAGSAAINRYADLNADVGGGGWNCGADLGVREQTGNQ